MVNVIRFRSHTLLLFFSHRPLLWQYRRGCPKFLLPGIRPACSPTATALQCGIMLRDRTRNLIVVRRQPHPSPTTRPALLMCGCGGPLVSFEGGKLQINKKKGAISTQRGKGRQAVANAKKAKAEAAEKKRTRGTRLQAACGSATAMR